MDTMTHFRDLARESAERAWRAPVGWMSPFWLAYGAAVGAGAAWWWVNQYGRPANLEAAHGQEAAPPAALLSQAPLVETSAPPIARQPEILADEAPRRDPRSREKAADRNQDVMTAPAEPKIEPAVATDDLTRIVGIGPRLAASLAERGVTSFAQMAAWSDQEISEIDAALKLKGGVSRHAWVAQARRFAGHEG